MFETDKEVLDWYEKQPRALSKEYVNSIKWNEIKNNDLKEFNQIARDVPALVVTDKTD